MGNCDGRVRLAIGKLPQAVDLIVSVWHTIHERNLGFTAAGVAFYTMFAIFPGMAATIAIWGLFADPLVIRDYMAQIHGVIPDAAYGILDTQLSALLAANSRVLGWASGLSVIVALYSVHSGVSALISGLNTIEARAPKSGASRILGSLFLTFALIGLFLAALATVVLVPVALNFVSLGPAEGVIIRFLPWAVMFVVVLLVLGLFYRWAPNVVRKRHGWVTPGAILAALLWAGASMGFSAYLTNFGSYNRIYGSIGAVVALLMWLYISAYIVLLGAALNAEWARINQRTSS
ncbi:MAG: YihY/virulence factor BrkB family protein [Albidovulum sp.]